MLLIFIIIYVLGFLWQFKPLKFSWENFTIRDFNIRKGGGYDKNPKETFIK